MFSALLAAAAARRQLRPARCQTSALDAIYSIGVDGAGLTRQTHSPCHDTLSARRRVRRRRQPSRLLPDGTRFAFLRKQRRTGPYPSRDKAAALSAANTNGTGLHPITAHGQADSHPGRSVR